MKKQYRVTGTRKGDRTSQVMVVRDTEAEAEAWIHDHRIEEKNAHAYQVLTSYETDEGYRAEVAYYLVNGMEVHEGIYLDVIAGKR